MVDLELPLKLKKMLKQLKDARMRGQLLKSVLKCAGFSGVVD